MVVGKVSIEERVGAVMAITWMTGIALGALTALLMVLLLAFFWDRICFFWMDHAGPWMRRKFGPNVKKCFDAVITFVNTPMSTLRQGTRAAWKVFKRGINKYTTSYRLKGDQVETETVIDYGGEVMITKEVIPKSKIDPKIATEMHCSGSDEWMVDNVGCIEEKMKRAEASC